MIKKYTFILIALLLLFGTKGYCSGSITFIVHGKVYDTTGTPITGHKVEVSTDEGYSKEVFTDVSGNYGDTIPDISAPQVLVHISTRDCKDVVHSQSVLAGTQATIVNFSICGEILPPKTFHLGGLLFAGNFPINNPVSTGDTGVAYLYRMENQSLIAWDTSVFTEFGYFVFLHIPEGQYRLKAGLTCRSTHFNSFIPAWFPGELAWNKSGMISLTDSNIYQSDVHLVAKGTLTAGNGRIGGFVVNSSISDYDGGERVSEAEVILYSSDNTPLDYRITDTDGNFEFGSLPCGSYRLFIDYPGKYSIYTDLAISETEPVLEGVKLELFPRDVNGISELSNGNQISSLFPNPVKDRISFRCNFASATHAALTIINENGSQVGNKSLDLPTGNGVVSVSAAEFRPGLYLLIIRDEEGNLLSSQKFVKK